MRRAPYLALLFAAAVTGIIVESCGGGGSVTGGDPGAVDRIPIKLPLFTAWSTDLLDSTEGTAANPLRIAFSPNCIWNGVQPDCNQPLPLPVYSWPQSNSIATSRDFFRWRGAMNNEDTWAPACNTGPPNQSLPLGVYPITWEPTDRTLRFGFELQNESSLCQKIPYVSVSYVRGVQGDPQPDILPWGHEPQLVFFTRLELSPSDLPSHVRHVYIWAHYRDRATGKRYMPHRVLWTSPWGYPDDFALAWNWPIEGGFQFAGAGRGPYLHGGRVGCDKSVVPTFEVQGATHWTVNLEGLARCRFPELDQVKPDFLGFEIAAEGTYRHDLPVTGLPNSLFVTLSDVGLSAIP